MAESEIHGNGLFAGAEISRGTLIGFYEGKETLQNGVYVLWVQQDNENADRWTGYDGTNELRFLNHAVNPNCELDGQDLYAARAIEKHEELTFDYGEWFEDGSE